MIDTLEPPGPEGDARRWGEWPGYQLVSYGSIGLPVYRVLLQVIAIERRDLNAIHEFILRSLEAGLREEPEIAGFLGLSPELVRNELAELLTGDMVAPSEPSTGPPSWNLTRKARETLESKLSTRPREMSAVAYFDGLLRQPRALSPGEVLRPRDAKAMSLPEVALSRMRRPTVEEIDPKVLEGVLAAGKRKRKGELSPTILRVSAVDRAEMLFRPAVALIFRTIEGEDLRLRIVIDGRLSEQHAQRLQEQGILQQSHWFQQLGHREPQPQELAELVQPEVVEAVAEAVAGPRQASIRPLSRLAPAEEDILEPPQAVRPLSVFEHPQLLRYGLEKSKSRLVIISPWIRAAVVDHEFLKRLEECLNRGVKVVIGYGFGDDSKAGFSDKRAQERLDGLQSKGLILRRLGNNHAKILIVDEEFYVVSSFNWLSFKGDSAAPFREEWGVLVCDGAQVNDLYRRWEAKLESDGAP